MEWLALAIVAFIGYQQFVAKPTTKTDDRTAREKLEDLAYQAAQAILEALSKSKFDDINVVEWIKIQRGDSRLNSTVIEANSGIPNGPYSGIAPNVKFDCALKFKIKAGKSPAIGLVSAGGYERTASTVWVATAWELAGIKGFPTSAIEESIASGVTVSAVPADPVSNTFHGFGSGKTSTHGGVSVTPK
jgi:hypothetical protein